MFLTLTTTGTSDAPATDLGFLLHKHPDKAQRFDVSCGTAHVFYPEASAEVCTVALLLDVDPVALVRRGRGKGRGGAPDSALAQYVNDRPYAASSLLAVALGKVFRSALAGQCPQRPALVETRLPLRIEVPSLPARGGAEMVRRLFEPLGWHVRAEPVPLDVRFPEWGASRYVRLTLDGRQRLRDALRQLYVMMPVLDGAKHYWVTADEVEKLLRAGDGWLEQHPERQVIVGRYLARRGSLTRQAMQRLELARLAESDDSDPAELDNAVGDEVVRDEAVGDEVVRDEGETDGGNDGDAPVTGALTERPVHARPLAAQRRDAILAAVRESGAARVVDLGCGEGRLVSELLAERRITHVTGVDVSMRALHTARRTLRLDRMSEREASRISLLQSSLTYTDSRLKGYDAAVLSEVIEHLDAPRLPALEYAVFGSARPSTVVVTTPNAEYNVRWESLPAGRLRHDDHRFEWTRAQFREWAERVAARHRYVVELRPVGGDDPEVGPPTQLALFTALSREAAA